MTIALWCLLAAALMPVIAVGISKAGARFDNDAPRSSSEGLPGHHLRAHWAHLNCYEALPFYAAAVIVAEMKARPGAWIDGLALAFIAARLVYVALYVGGFPTLRSAMWGVAFAINIAIFTLPAWR